ncbi:MAG: diadenosine tetraphosphate hydrolase [Patescibacteria group bacterium]
MEINNVAKVKEIIDYKGNVKKIACLSCAREKSKINLGNIAKSKYFDAHQDYEIPISGFIVISSRRHFQSVDEFTNNEQKDFIKILCRIRSAMRKVLGIKIVYLFQAEDTSHHFYLWIVPRYGWMEKKFGRKIESVRPIIKYSKENLRTKPNLARVDEATQKLKQFFSNDK